MDASRSVRIAGRRKYGAKNIAREEADAHLDSTARSLYLWLHILERRTYQKRTGWRLRVMMRNRKGRSEGDVCRA